MNGTKLASCAVGRDNNFNLVRIVAASSVLVSHSYALTLGSGDLEPMRRSLGMTPGTMAVDVFFIASGFLVTASLLTRQSVVEFAWARLLRIFPGLLVMLALTVFGMGLLVTDLPARDYVVDAGTWHYLYRCGTLVRGVAYNLPGVFEHNPYKGTVNGSLWTMPIEIRMYVLLALFWVGASVFKSAHRRVFQWALIVSAMGSLVVLQAMHGWLHKDHPLVHLFYMFFMGAAFYVLRHRIRLSAALFWPMLTALLGSVFLGAQAFFVVYSLTLAYLLFYVAYIPAGVVRGYNRFGDYSYGIYIYAFPLQQLVVAWIPGASVAQVLALSALLTAVMAFLSWHLVENRALNLKARYVGSTRALIAKLAPTSSWSGTK